ncbi:MAG TPA: glycine C-acetyltransferase [Clostridiales bacterium]|jgi:glycine C-acetyltransferase|nr:glycine C-acetyltransferase [Clostridiales bacterium]HQP70073.1 glycine C-acetyltransferase [Clostridiales bacterium]
MSFEKDIKNYYIQQLSFIREQNLFKQEKQIHSPQFASINAEYPKGVRTDGIINICSNNYLGMSDHPEVIKAAKETLDSRGYGMSSVRFICGTQDIHIDLENKMSLFLGMDDTILFSSAFDANLGIFEALLDEECAIFTDSLNHASIIDGTRLCKAKKFRYANNDMDDLQLKLEEEKDHKIKLIVTDGVFSMDGIVAQVDKICELAKMYKALVMVDDSHATGFIGKNGRGTHELHNVMGEVDIISTTFGKALGGASGGCISGRQELIDILRQKARPYLFSNSISPVVVGGVLKVMNMIMESTERRDKLELNTQFWKNGLKEAGFILTNTESPIIPVMLFNAKLAQDFSLDLYAEGVYAIGFFYPVVPKGKARIRTQMSAAHETEHLEKALDAFRKVGKKYDILGRTREEIIEMYPISISL